MDYNDVRAESQGKDEKCDMLYVKCDMKFGVV
jgi:hypothetical protein